MTIKNLLNFIVIEVEAGRLSEDAEVHVFNSGTSKYSRIRDIEVYAGKLDLEIVRHE